MAILGLFIDIRNRRFSRGNGGFFIASGPRGKGRTT